MKLKYKKSEEVDAELDINVGDYVLEWNKRPVRVIAVIGEAIITEYPLNPMWSNKIYTAEQVMSYGGLTIPPPTP